MISKTTQSPALIQYLEQDKYINLNALNYLAYNKNAEVYLFEGDIEKGAILGDSAQEIFFLATNHPVFLQEFWEQLPPGIQCFSGVPKSIALPFQAGKRIIWESPCKTYVQKSALEQAPNPAYEADSLTIEDAEEVDAHYTYRWEGSLQLIRESIALCDSACIRIAGELAAWCLVHAEDGSMGPLYTKEQYRGRGFAETVTLQLMEKLLAKGLIPYVQIAEGNSASLQLAGKIKGMEYSHDCVWLGIEK